MTEAELTLDERNHLWTLVGASFLVVSFSFLALLLYFSRNEPLIGWNIFVQIGLPYGIIGPTTVFLAYEVFYPKRVRKSRMFHVKRFARRAIIGIVVILSLSAVTSVSDVTFSRTLGDNAIFPGITLWLVVAVAAVFLWLRRQNFKRRLSSETL